MDKVLDMVKDGDKRSLIMKSCGILFLSMMVISHFGGRGKFNRAPTLIEASIRALKSRGLFSTLLIASLSSLFLRKYFKLNPTWTLPSFFIALWSIIYRLRVVELPTVWYRRTYFNTTVVEKSILTKEYYYPIPWAFNRHGQTITCFVLSHLEWMLVENIIYEREEIPCWDAPNVQHLDWATINDTSKHSINHGYGEKAWDTPILFCVYGLGNDRDIHYIKRCARHFLNKGWRVVIWSNWRFDFEDSRDMHIALEHIQQKYPAAPITAMGWSAGGYPLIRYLQKAKASTPLVAAVTQGACFDFEQAVKDVTNNEMPTYRVFLLIQVKICAWRHLENDKHIPPEKKDALYKMVREELDPLRIYNQLHEAITPRSNEENPRKAPLALSYLSHSLQMSDNPDWVVRTEESSLYKDKAINHMEDISITTLMLHTEDDPVVSSEHIDWTKMEKNRHIIVGHTIRGGHCSWYEGLLPFGDTFGDRVAASFLSSVLETHAQSHFFL